MVTNNISNNIKTLRNSKDLSKNSIPSSSPILKPGRIGVRESMLMFLVRFSFSLYLVGIFQYFYNYNSYEFIFKKNILQEKSELRTERILSENITVISPQNVEDYYMNKRIDLLSKIRKFESNINGTRINAWDDCDGIASRMIPKLNEISSKIYNNINIYYETFNQTLLDIWKQEIDQNMTTVEEEWIRMFNNTDTSNITTICSPKKYAQMTSPSNVLTIFLPVFFFIFVTIIIFLIFKNFNSIFNLLYSVLLLDLSCVVEVQIKVLYDKIYKRCKRKKVLTSSRFVDKRSIFYVGKS